MEDKDKCECGCGEDLDAPIFEYEEEFDHVEDLNYNDEEACETAEEPEQPDSVDEQDCENEEVEQLEAEIQPEIVEDCACDNKEGCGCNCENDNEETCDCHHECHCEENKEYLKDMLRIQAEFDNYRRRMTTALGDARKDGFIDAIEQFLPALDSFKMATDMITDKNTLMGIKFIEKGILDTLSKMGVEEIDTTGKFNPEFHQAIDTEDNEEYESGDIIKVASKGFVYKGKVIRYSQVIVKK